MARDSTWMLAALPTTNTKLYPGQSCPQNRIVDVISFFESGGLAEVFAVFHPILLQVSEFSPGALGGCRPCHVSRHIAA
jgi:hypothetical protein